MDEAGVKLSLGNEVGSAVFIEIWVLLLVVLEFETSPDDWEADEIPGKSEVPGIVNDKILGRAGGRLIGAGIFTDRGGGEEDDGDEELEEMGPVERNM